MTILLFVVEPVKHGKKTMCALLLCQPKQETESPTQLSLDASIEIFELSMLAAWHFRRPYVFAAQSRCNAAASFAHVADAWRDPMPLLLRFMVGHFVISRRGALNFLMVDG